jgi:hypothetical protein
MKILASLSSFDEEKHGKKKQQKQTPNVTLPSQIIRVGLKIGCPSESCLFEVSPHLLNKTYFDLIINLLHCI